jgi:hypothetical protein
MAGGSGYPRCYQNADIFMANFGCATEQFVAFNFWILNTTKGVYVVENKMLLADVIS